MKLKKDIFYISTIKCARCTSNIKRLFYESKGVLEVRSNEFLKLIQVTFDSDIITKEMIENVLRVNGYTSSVKGWKFAGAASILCSLVLIRLDRHFVHYFISNCLTFISIFSFRKCCGIKMFSCLAALCCYLWSLLHIFQSLDRCYLYLSISVDILFYVALSIFLEDFVRIMNTSRLNKKRKDVFYKSDKFLRLKESQCVMHTDTIFHRTHNKNSKIKSADYNENGYLKRYNCNKTNSYEKSPRYSLLNSLEIYRNLAESMSNFPDNEKMGFFKKDLNIPKGIIFNYSHNNKKALQNGLMVYSNCKLPQRDVFSMCPPVKDSCFIEEYPSSEFTKRCTWDLIDGMNRLEKKLSQDTYKNKNNPQLIINKSHDMYDIIGPENINIGDSLLIKSHQFFPADGYILDLKATVDESNLTGESQYKNKIIREKVYSGTLNVGPDVRIRVDKICKDTLQGSILETMESQLLSDPDQMQIRMKILGVLSCIITLIHIIGSVFGYKMVCGDLFFSRFYPARVFLTMILGICPCSINLCKPIMFLVAVNILFKKNIAINLHHQLPSKIHTVFLDKTGTLTEKLTVKKFCQIVSKSSEQRHSRKFFKLVWNDAVLKKTLRKCKNLYVILERRIHVNSSINKSFGFNIHRCKITQLVKSLDSCIISHYRVGYRKLNCITNVKCYKKIFNLHYPMCLERQERCKNNVLGFSVNALKKNSGKVCFKRFNTTTKGFSIGRSSMLKLTEIDAIVLLLFIESCYEHPVALSIEKFCIQKIEKSLNADQRNLILSFFLTKKKKKEHYHIFIRNMITRNCSRDCKNSFETPKKDIPAHSKGTNHFLTEFVAIVFSFLTIKIKSAFQNLRRIFRTYEINRNFQRRSNHKFCKGKFTIFLTIVSFFKKEVILGSEQIIEYWRFLKHIFGAKFQTKLLNIAVSSHDNRDNSCEVRFTQYPMRKNSQNEKKISPRLYELLNAANRIVVKRNRQRVMGVIYLKKFSLIYKIKKKGQRYVFNLGTSQFQFKIDEVIKKEAYGLVKYLKSQNFDIQIISGDTKQQTLRIAQKLGISKAHSSLTSEKKLHIVLETQKIKKCAYIGDGVNDLLSLKAVDIGVSINPLHNKIFCTLLDGNIKNIPMIFRLCKSLQFRLKTCETIFIIYNICSISICSGFLSIWGLYIRPENACASMFMSSLFLVFYALTLYIFEVV